MKMYHYAYTVDKEKNLQALYKNKFKKDDLTIDVKNDNCSTEEINNVIFLCIIIRKYNIWCRKHIFN